LRDAVPRAALAAPFRDTTVQALACEALHISHVGLRNRKRINDVSQDETVYIAPLEMLAACGTTVADELLACFAGHWRGNIDHIFMECAF
jgi:glutamate--cysteine ligase